MIRLNVFFEKKEEVKVEEINALCKELVEKSLKDNGNIAYDYFTSGTRNGVMMICETWENEEVLKAHMASEHFTTLVPKIFRHQPVMIHFLLHHRLMFCIIYFYIIYKRSIFILLAYGKENTCHSSELYWRI